MLFERCIQPRCKYELDYDLYAVGKQILSAAGFCPICTAHTLIFCPACQGIDVVKYFIEQNYVCRKCDVNLAKFTGRYALKLQEKEKAVAALLKAKHLTPREIQILRLTAEGNSNKQIADALRLSVCTVESYRARIMLKLQIHSLVELVHFAIEQQLVAVRKFQAEIPTS